MLNKEQILDLIHTHLNDTNKYLVDLKISSDNRISVFIDGDNGITIDDCIALSRTIERNLNRDEEDFELNVSSSGIDSPLKLNKQYIKNTGRQLKVVKTNDEIIEGKLLSVDGENISLELAHKKKKKKEEKEENTTIQISFEEIKEARVIVTF